MELFQGSNWGNSSREKDLAYFLHQLGLGFQGQQISQKCVFLPVDAGESLCLTHDNCPSNVASPPRRACKKAGIAGLSFVEKK